MVNESFIIRISLRRSKGFFIKKYAFHVENHIPVSALTCSAGIEQFYKDYQFFVINGDGLYEFIYVGKKKEKKNILSVAKQSF
jgi:hypothetical protein